MPKRKRAQQEHGLRGGERQQGDGGGHDHVDEDHDALLRPAVGEPAHEQAPHDAPDEDEGEDRRPPGPGRGRGRGSGRASGSAWSRPPPRWRPCCRGRGGRRRAAGRPPAIETGAAADACGRGGSFTRRAAGSAIRIIRTPRAAQGPAPAQGLGEGVGQERHERAPDADAEVGDAHGLAAARVEPAGEHHLVGQGTAAHVAEGVQQVEEVEGAEAGDSARGRRGRGPPSGCRRSSGAAGRSGPRTCPRGSRRAGPRSACCRRCPR